MKNKYLKGAHISETKMSELLNLFCEDHTATQIAAAVGISRVTANAYFKLLRSHIAAFCEEKNPLKRYLYNEPLVIGELAVPANESLRKKCLYGITIAQDFVYTNRLFNAEYSVVYDYLKSPPETDHPMIKHHNLDIYHGIVDFNTLTFFPLKQRENGSAKFYAADNGPDHSGMFWDLLRSRLVKFRGLNNSTLHLHVKETEFRFNYRNEDIFGLLLGIIQHKPLHLSKGGFTNIIPS